MNYKNKIIQTVRKYNNKKRECGFVDCNMMILEIYEPQYYDLMYGTYTNIKDGIRKAKELTGYRSITEFVKQSDNYIKVTQDAARFGDIGIIKDKSCTFIHLGKTLFGVQKINEREIFMQVDKFHTEEYEYYRRL